MYDLLQKMVWIYGGYQFAATKKDLTRSCDSSDKVLYRISTMPSTASYSILSSVICSMEAMSVWVSVEIPAQTIFCPCGAYPACLWIDIRSSCRVIQSNDFIAFCIKNTRQLCKGLCFRLEPSEGFDPQLAAYKASALPLSHDGKYIIFVGSRK